MEYKRRLNRGIWLQKAIVSLVFGLFTAQAQAQLLSPKPSIIVPPVGISVQIGGTAILTLTEATALLTAPITSVDWYFVTATSTNLITTGVVTVNSGVLASSVLTITNVSLANQGTYIVSVNNKNGSATASVTLVVLLSTVSNVVNAVVGGNGMLDSGYKVQYSGPVGSNLVIQASSDMNNWSCICTNVVPAGGSVSYTDTVAKTCSCRFYRAMLK